MVVGLTLDASSAARVRGCLERCTSYGQILWSFSRHIKIDEVAIRVAEVR